MPRPYPTPEEQVALAVRVKAGDRTAAGSLIAAVSGFIHKRAVVLGRRFGLNRDATYIEDLYQEGAIGVLHAADKFDPTVGVKFLTYAANWIDQRICRRVERDASIIHIPLNVRAMSRRQRYAVVSHALHYRVKDAIQRADSMLSMDQHVSRGRVAFEMATRLGDTIPDSAPLPDVRAEAAVAAVAVRRMLANIEDVRLRALIDRRFLREPRYSLEALGKTFGVTREMARQLEKKAVGQLLRICGVTDRTPRDVIKDFAAMCRGDLAELDADAISNAEAESALFIARCADCGVRVISNRDLCASCRGKRLAAKKAMPKKRGRACGICGKLGHNRASCSTVLPASVVQMTAPLPAPPPAPLGAMAGELRIALKEIALPVSVPAPVPVPVPVPRVERGFTSTPATPEEEMAEIILAAVESRRARKEAST